MTVGAALAVGSATTDDVYGPYNDDWDGTSDIRNIATDDGAESVPLQEPSRYDNYGDGDVAFVIGPGGLSANETGQVQSFVERGGTVVIAYRNDSRGDALLADLGVDARPNGSVLRDEVHYHRSPNFPVATETADHELTAGVPSVTLNHGTAVDADEASVLIWSSPYSYLDHDETGEPGNGEVGPRPVATAESVGDGEVIVVSDPGIFINVMQEQDGNEAFTRSLVGEANHVIVDAGEGEIPPLVSAILIIRESTLLQAGLGLGVLGIVGIVVKLVVRHREDASL